MAFVFRTASAATVRRAQVCNHPRALVSDKDRDKRLLGAQSADIDALLALAGDALLQVTPRRIGEARAAASGRCSQP